MKFLTKEEMDKIREFQDYIDRAYWRVWFGKAYFDGMAVEENLKRAKKVLEELGV